MRLEVTLYLTPMKYVLSFRMWCHAILLIKMKDLEESDAAILRVEESAQRV
jgi:hypothetical protein